MADQNPYPAAYIRLSLSDSAPVAKPEQCALLVTFPGGGMGVCYGSRSQCEERWARVQKDHPEATHEIRPMSDLEAPIDRDPIARLDMLRSAVEREGLPVPDSFVMRPGALEAIRLAAHKGRNKRLGWREKRRAAGAKRRSRQ